MRITRVITLAAAAAVEVPSVVRADGPLRSGTITGWGYTWPAMFSGEAKSWHRMDAHVSRRLVVLVAVLAALALPSSVRAEEPLRSGTIVAAAADTSDYTWLWPWPGCNGAPACWAWTEARCPDEMVGLDPAVTSSIEHVSDLADGITLRTLEFHTASPAGLANGHLIAEFWNDDCRQIFTSPGQYQIPCSRGDCPEFPIPVDANWMTITSKPRNANIEWTLT